MLLCLSSSDWWVLEQSPDASSDEAFDARMASRSVLAFGGAPGDVGLRGRVAPLLGDGDVVERPVQLTVTATVEAVAGLVLTGGRFDR